MRLLPAGLGAKSCIGAAPANSGGKGAATVIARMNFDARGELLRDLNPKPAQKRFRNNCDPEGTGQPSQFDMRAAQPSIAESGGELLRAICLRRQHYIPNIFGAFEYRMDRHMRVCRRIPELIHKT